MYLFCCSVICGALLSIPLMHWGIQWSAGLVGILLAALLFLWGFAQKKALFADTQQGVCWLISAVALLGMMWHSQMTFEQRLAERLRVPTSLTATVRVVGLSDSIGQEWRQVVQPTPALAGLPSRWLVNLPRTDSSEGVPAEPPMMRAGELWQVDVQLEPIRGRASIGVFDVERWLVLERNIGAQATLMSAERLPHVVSLSWFDRVDRIRLQLRTHFEQFNSADQGILLGLLTGDRALISSEQKALYQQVGISHLLAISGPHVLLAAGILAAGLGKLLNLWPQLYLRMERRRWQIPIFLCAVVGYAMLAGWELPAQRTVWMALVVSGLAWWRQRWPVMQVLAVAASGVLLFDPLAVLSAAFWLSFGAVWLLLWLGRHRSPEQPAGTVLQRIWLALKQLFGLQCLLTLALLPLVLSIFGQFSL
ncbi:MAG: ComEC/Rec2 family competence protein, partial [Pseudomonadota bacterium]|nr:ComEC/Rec2 family competence protein [Pseudomonadota bacterium]